MTVTRARRVGGDRRVALLGLATAVVLLVVGGTGMWLTADARRELRENHARLEPPRRHLEQGQFHLDTLVTGYLELLTTFDTEAVHARSVSALVGRAHQEMSQSWRAYEATAAGLPGEAELAEAIRPAMGLTEERGESILAANGPVPAGDPAALVARLAYVGVVVDALGASEPAIRSLLDLYDDAADDNYRSVRQGLDEVISTTTRVAAAAGVPLMAAFVGLARRTRRRERELALVAAARDADADRNEFEARLQRGIDMARSEELTFPVIETAVAQVVGDRPAELLVADSSHAHFRQVARTAACGPESGCPVGSPADCPAVQRGQTQMFASGGSMDACPHLRDREVDVSAVCVPVSIAGRGSGVLHAVGPLGKLAPEDVVDRLELVARKVGDRIGMLRAFSRSETQARTDPLTGLLNRRSLEEDVRDLDGSSSYVVAFGDLDHFKQLNDVHGHDAGDRALRLFARVLRDGVRPDDLPARYGGEEFVVVLPDCTVDDASMVVERLRARLEESLHRGSVFPFTVSFGIARAQPGDRFADVVERADLALLEAKATGRDRTVVRAEPADPLLPL